MMKIRRTPSEGQPDEKDLRTDTQHTFAHYLRPLVHFMRLNSSQYHQNEYNFF